MPFRPHHRTSIALAASLGSAAELYSLLVESVRDYAIFALDRDGYIVSWNPGAQRFKGYEASEIVGKHFSVFYPPDDLATGKPDRELEIAEREGRLEDEGWRVRKDGTRFWASVVITALRSPDGELVGFAKVTRDLTERHLAEQQALDAARRIATEEAMRVAAEERTRALTDLVQQLQAQSEELQRRRAEADAANRAKSDFLAAVSHELRTPLNAISGFAELLLIGLRGPLTEAQRSDVERIQRSQQQLLGLINDILNFSRLESGRVAFALTTVALRPLIDRVASAIAPQAATKQIALDRGDCPDTIAARADEPKVEQILLNLLSNAVKFTPPNGRVSLRCATDATRVFLHVEDTGPGIPDDRRTAIFEPFVQLGRGLTTPGGGTGLGLAISRDLARGMGGDLTVASAAGAGSTFTLSLERAGGLVQPDA